MNSEYSMDQVLIEKLTNILEVNFDKENFGVKKLAKKAGLSRSKLHRKLHSIKGKSTSKFIREYRLEKALSMLQNNVATASEISYRVGFSSPQYFSKCFQDYYGYTPGEAKYRTHSLIEDNKETKKKELIGGFQKRIETIKNRINLISKRMIWVNTLGVVLISVFSYYLYSNYYFSSETHSTDGNERSIAIIPFNNLSDNIENQYFADGMMDDILHHLSGIKGLVVKSRQSSERYRESDKSIIKIGKELGADYLLVGSVQKQEDRIRIIVQLIEAKQDSHVWAKNYDFELKQVFAVQSEISEQIAHQLNMVISSLESGQIKNTPTENLEAYNLYLKGRFFWHRRTEVDMKKSIIYFEKAVELDSTYALAYAGLADSYFIITWYGWPVNKYSFNKAKEYALKALSIDNTIPAPHATLGGIATWYEWNWKDAEKEFKKAITLNPNYATAHQYYAELLDILGRNKEAREQIDLAIKLNPNSFMMHSISAMLYTKAGLYDKALIDANRAKEIDKNQGWPYWIIFESYRNLGRNDEAITEMEEWWNLEPNLEMAKASRVAYDKSGINGFYKYIIDYDLEKGYAHKQAYVMAQKYAFIEENEKALEWIERAMINKELGIIQIKNDPYFKDLHNEPRFKAILKQMGLEEK